MKGYFFMIDAFIGATILFVTIALLVTSSSRNASTVQPYTTLNTLTNYLAETEFRDVNVEIVNSYSQQGLLDPEKTILQQLVHWDYEYANGCLPCREYALNVSAALISGTLPQSYGLRFVVNNTLLYNTSVDTENESTIFLTTQRVALDVINDTSFYGPVLVEVSLWV